MPETVTLIAPKKLNRNPENPRLIFQPDELEALQESIAIQGILVPLTVYRDGRSFFLLDGERRCRCAIKLGLQTVPVIIQPKPDRMQNLMMMFAIHNTRRDWDPLPAALKLAVLEREFRKRNGRKPTEADLAGIASLSRGEVRRLKNLLALPRMYRDELLRELKKPRSEQVVTADHLLEATRASGALRKRDIIDEKSQDLLIRAILAKFRTKVIVNTVAPRKLVRLARAVQRGEVARKTASRVVQQLIVDTTYSIEQAFQETVEQADFQHNVELLVGRLSDRLEEHRARSYDMPQSLRDALAALYKRIGDALGR